MAVRFAAGEHGPLHVGISIMYLLIMSLPCTRRGPDRSSARACKAHYKGAHLLPHLDDVVFAIVVRRAGAILCLVVFLPVCALLAHELQ